jgi:ATP-dependent DNA helicase PIF1
MYNDLSKLSPEQKYAFHRFTLGENLFITGPGGTGKTRLIQYFVEYSIKNNKACQVCALTGCAAILLKCNARTIHSWSGIRIAKGNKQDIIHNVLKNKKIVQEWRTKKVLIIDEVSMMSEKIFELLDELGRAIRRIQLPFGGLQVIFTGDFFQLPPVGTYGEPDTERFCFESSKWLDVFPLTNHIELKTIFRQKDPLYIDILSQIRKGGLDEEKRNLLNTYVKRDFDVAKHSGCVPVKLFALRNKADFVNKTMFEKIEEKQYDLREDIKTNCDHYIDSGKSFSKETIEKCRNLSLSDKEKEIEFLRSSIPCADVLTLKKGTIVMCIFNIDIEMEICNGSQGVVVDIIETNQEIKPIVKFANGITLTMGRQYWQSEEYPTIAIGQIPLCLAWAFTIHKIQGSTMSMAEIDIGMTIFEYGQIYVALSRIESLDGLYLLNFNPHKIKANPKVIAFYENIPPIDYTTMDYKKDFSQYEYKELEEESILEDLIEETPKNKKVVICNTTANSLRGNFHVKKC